MADALHDKLRMLQVTIDQDKGALYVNEHVYNVLFLSITCT